jgi:hypothetical protein
LQPPPTSRVLRWLQPSIGPWYTISHWYIWPLTTRRSIVALSNFFTTCTWYIHIRSDYIQPCWSWEKNSMKWTSLEIAHMRHVANL